MNPARTSCLVALITLVASSSTAAQDPSRASGVREVVKQVMIDPTTYAPAIVGWKATRLDWRSSQTFFQHGWVEQNPRFTASGHGDDIAIGYADGNRQILADALVTLQVSLVNNVSDRVVERLLIPRYPNHRTLIRTIGWIERSAMASYWSYLMSAGHLRQWQENDRRAQQLGFN